MLKYCCDYNVCHTVNTLSTKRPILIVNIDHEAQSSHHRENGMAALLKRNQMLKGFCSAMPYLLKDKTFKKI